VRNKILNKTIGATVLPNVLASLQELFDNPFLGNYIWEALVQGHWRTIQEYCGGGVWFQTSSQADALMDTNSVTICEAKFDENYNGAGRRVLLTVETNSGEQVVVPLENFGVFSQETDEESSAGHTLN